VWHNRTEVCLLVPLQVRLHCGNERDCAFPEIAEVKKLMEVQDKKEEGGGWGGGEDKSEQKLQEVLRKAGNRTAIQVSKGKERKHSLGLA